MLHRKKQPLFVCFSVRECPAYAPAVYPKTHNPLIRGDLYFYDQAHALEVTEINNLRLFTMKHMAAYDEAHGVYAQAHDSGGGGILVSH